MRQAVCREFVWREINDHYIRFLSFSLLLRNNACAIHINIPYPALKLHIFYCHERLQLRYIGRPSMRTVEG